MRRKALALCRSDGDGSVGAREVCRRGAVLLRAENLGVEPAVGQHQESPAVLLEELALAQPGVAVRAGRVGEPVAGEGEAAAHGDHRSVAGVLIAVKADGG